MALGHCLRLRRVIGCWDRPADPWRRWPRFARRLAGLALHNCGGRRLGWGRRLPQHQWLNWPLNGWLGFSARCFGHALRGGHFRFGRRRLPQC